MEGKANGPCLDIFPHTFLNSETPYTCVSTHVKQGEFFFTSDKFVVF